MNIKRALKSIAKGVSTFTGPMGAPLEALLYFFEDKQTQEREAQLDAMILEGQSLNRETLEEIFQAREEIKELRAQFILAMEICFSILAENRKLLFIPYKQLKNVQQHSFIFGSSTLSGSLCILTSLSLEI